MAMDVEIELDLGGAEGNEDPMCANRPAMGAVILVGEVDEATIDVGGARPSVAPRTEGGAPVVSNYLPDGAGPRGRAVASVAFAVFGLGVARSARAA